MVPCPGRVLRYQGERLRAADHVASSSAAVKDVSRLRLPVRRTRYSAGPVGGFLRRRGAARWTSGQPQSGFWCSSWRFPSSPAPHQLHPVHRGVLHLGVSVQFRQTREHHAAHVAGWSRTSTSASLSTCAGGSSLSSGLRAVGVARRVGGWKSAAPLLQSCSDGVPLSRLVGGLCSIVRLATAFSRGQGLGSADGYGRCSLEVRKRLHTALRQARGRLRSGPGERHVRRVPLSRTDQLRMTHTCCSAQVGSAFSSFSGGRDEDAVCAACLSAVAGLFE